MAKSFTHYQTIKNKQYASIYTPQEKTAKKTTNPNTYDAS